MFVVDVVVVVKFKLYHKLIICKQCDIEYLFNNYNYK